MAQMISSRSLFCCKFLQRLSKGNVGFLPNSVPVFNKLIGVRFKSMTSNKHWNPKFKKYRKLKMIKVDLPDFNKSDEDMTPEEIKKVMKEKGLVPPRPWKEQPFFLSCLADIFDPYVPPEGDGKLSVITKSGAKQKIIRAEKKSKTMLAIRKIRGYDEEFDVNEFAQHAQEVYINAHNALCNNLKDLDQYVTERAYGEMILNVQHKTIHWKFLQSLEPPRVVYARATELITKENVFAQITVRFHSQQLLAIYDRFGRLMHGSEILAKDVLEYIVFEKHLANEYGKWRLHAKIIPDWLPKKDPSLRTYRVVEDAGESQSEESLERGVEAKSGDEVEHTEKKDVAPAIA